LNRWTRFVIRRRLLVVAVWVVVLVVSALVSRGLSDLLTNRFSIPGSDTARAEKILEDEFGQRSDGTFQLVFAADSPASAKVALPRLEAAARRAAGVVATGRSSRPSRSPSGRWPPS
jgi:putative drug exporter of the RND superfamily